MFDVSWKKKYNLSNKGFLSFFIALDKKRVNHEMLLLPFSSFIHDAFETFGKYSVFYCFDKCSLYLLLTFAVDHCTFGKGGLISLVSCNESFLIESESITGPQ